jgi:proteasome-associated ATPase
VTAYGRPRFMGGDELSHLRYENETLKKRVEELSTGALAFATLIAHDGKTALISPGGGQLAEVTLPLALMLEPGDVVRIRNDAGGKSAIISRVESPPPVGVITKVQSILDETHFEAALSPHGESRVITHRKEHKVKVGDRVVLDSFASAIMTRNLGQADASKHAASDEGEEVTWEDVGGQEDAKRALREAVEDPIVHRDLFTKYKKRVSRGVLLYGPPGNGKTLLARAVASSIARRMGRKLSKTGFQYVKGPSLLDKFVGESEANVRRLFEQTRAHWKKEGTPCVLMIDEADSILGVRGASGFLGEGMERTIVPMFLAELDGFDPSGAFFLLATNRPDRLDPAILRDGRVDRKIAVKRPDEEGIRKILEIALLGRPQVKGLVEFAARAVEEKRPLYRLQCRAIDGVEIYRDLGYADLVSGARLVGLAERAAGHAIQREILGGKAGISERDIQQAIEEAVNEERGLDHAADLALFVEERKLNVEKVVRA